MDNKESIYVLQKLNPSDLNREDKVFKTAGAVILTYSIDNKTVLTGLMSLFNIPEKEKNDRDVEQLLSVKQRWEKLIRFENIDWQQERVGFICNDGYDNSMGSPISYYTEGFIAHYKIPAEKEYHSFHPKLFVIKYESEDETIFRFMIGSMNFVNSKAKEFITCFDLKAYEERQIEINDRENYIHINWVKELLGYKSLDKNEPKEFIGNENGGAYGRNIKKVLKNLGLERYKFKKDEVPEVKVFPGGKPIYEGCTDIFSPFLNTTLINDSEATIYTMESELKKLGYERCDSEDENTKSFYVYEISDTTTDQKLFSHFKIYINKEKSIVYAGSANYTKSAFERNKELLVKVQVKDDDIEGFLRQIRTGYKEYRYKQIKEPGKTSGDLFKKLAVDLGRVLKVQYENNTVGIKIREIDNTNYKGIYASWNKIKNENKQYHIEIAPLYYPSKRKEIKITEERITMEENGNTSIQDNWSGLHRRNISQMFSLYLLNGSDVEEKASVYLMSDGIFGGIHELQKAMRDEYLNRLLCSSSQSDISLNKEVEKLQQNMTMSKFIKSLRYGFPTLEDMLKKALKDGDIKNLFSLYSERINSYLEISRELKNNGGASDEEIQEYLYYDGKLIDNLNVQISNISKLFEGAESVNGV